MEFWLLCALPILTQLVRVVFASDTQMPPCIENSCNYLTKCERLMDSRSNVCTSQFPKYCNLNPNEEYEWDKCKQFGNFKCKMTCIGHHGCTNKCAHENVECKSRDDCSKLFECKDSYCSLTKFECYGDDDCNVFTKCTDFICKIDFQSAYTIGIIVGVFVGGLMILYCVISRLGRSQKSHRSDTLKSSGYRPNTFKSSGPRRF